MIILANLTQVELQNLRHLIGKHETAYQKFSTYAQDSFDPQVKDYFERSAQAAQNTKQKLITFLN